MTRKRIQDAIARVATASESKGILISISIGDPLDPVELERSRAEIFVRLPRDYSAFLLSANGLKLGFYVGGPEDGNPDFTFKLTSLAETIEGTIGWRTKAEKYLQEEEDPPMEVLSKPFRDLIDQVGLINPFSRVFVHPDTSHVYREDLRDLFGCGMLFEVATSFDEYFEHAFEQMTREGYMAHL